MTAGGFFNNRIAAMAEHEGTPANEAFTLAREIRDELCAIRKATEKSGTKPDIRRIPFVIDTTAGGDGTKELWLPAGVAWALQSYSWQVNGVPAAGYVAFYVDEEQGTGLVQADGFAARKTAQFNTGYYVPPMSKLIVAVRALGAQFQVAGNIVAAAATDGTPAETTTAGW